MATELTHNITQWIDKHYEDYKKYINGKTTLEDFYTTYPNFNEELAFIGATGEIEIVNHVIEKCKEVLYDSDLVVKTVSLIRIPALLLHPPPILDDIIIYDTNLGYQPISSDYEYMMNFRIDYNDAFLEKINHNHTDLQAQRNNVIRGQKKIFHNQVKTRGPSPCQALLISILTYLCDNCRSELSSSCHCYQSSAALCAIGKLCIRDRGIPFYLKKDQTVVKSELYPYISSQIPTLWYALIELTIRGSCGAVSQAFECAAVNEWIQQSAISLQHGVLYKFKKLKKASKIFRGIVDMVVPVYDSNFNIVGGRKKFKHRELLIDALIEHGVDHIYKIPRIPLTAEQAHHYHYQHQYITPSMLVMGSIELVLSKSAQATQPTDLMLSIPTLWADIGVSQLIPVEFKYDDVDILGVRNYIMETLNNHPPELTNLESKFIEIATTNSAGLTAEERAVRNATIKKEFGDDEDAKLISSCAGVRLFDVLMVIKRDLCNIETYRSGLNVDNASGLRYQVDRRPRLIQMLRSTLMVGPFIIQEVLKKLILNSDIAATGKTTNDVRDTYHQCMATSLSVRANSDDVVGMDTATHKQQTSFITSIVLSYLRNNRNTLGRFFFDAERATIRFKDIDGLVYEEEVSMIEMVVMCENFANNRSRKYYGGYFQREVYSSNITFESGTYKTSIQHTTLLSGVYGYVKRMYETKYANKGLRVHASVLGDDQFSYVLGVTSDADLVVISDEIKNKVTSILSLFGYTTDATYEEGFGEFLKQPSYNGVVVPFGQRLVCMTSERGEKGGIIDRIVNVHGVLNELSARVPKPVVIPALKIASAMILGVFKINLEYSPEITEEDIANTGLRYIKRGTRYYCTGRKLWYCNLRLGTPFPCSRNHGPSSYLTFPSPAYCKRIVDMCKKEVVLKTVPTDEIGVSKVISTAPELIKIYWMNVSRAIGNKLILAQWKLSPKTMPLTMNDIIDTSVFVELGFFDGYMMCKYSRALPSEFDSRKYPGFSMYQKMANRYLDQVKSSRSWLATTELRDAGVRVPDSVVYYDRGAQRLSSVVSMKDANNRRTLDVTNMIMHYNDKKKHNVNLSDSIGQCGYGVYTLNVTTGDTVTVDYSAYEYGLGPCVPPMSIQSRLVDILGLPRVSDYDIDSIKAEINSAILINGLDDAVIKIIGEAYRKLGVRGLNLALESVGLSKHMYQKVSKLITALSYDALTMPYAINPRHLYYYGTSRHAGNTKRFKPSNDTSSLSLQWAVYISEICMNSDLIDHNIVVSMF